MASCLKSELRALLVLAVPSIIGNLAQQGMAITDLAMVGNLLGTSSLAAAAIGNTLFSLLWYGLLGMSTAMDTLGSQAYGAKQQHQVVVAFVGASILLSILAIPMGVALWAAEWLAIVLFQQPPDVAVNVGVFCRCLIPGLIPLVLGVTLAKLMQVQGEMVTPAVINAVAFVFNIGASYGLTRWLGMAGAPAATSLTRLLQAALLGLLVWAPWSPRPPQARWDVRAAVRDSVRPAYVWRFMALGLPGGAAMSLEASSFDITTAFAGALGTHAVDAHTSLMQIVAASFLSFPFAVATASTIRIGHLLGAGCPRQAWTSTRLAVALGAGFGSVAGVSIWAARHQIGWLFVRDREVVDLVASIAPISALFEVLDAIMGTSQGALRGAGKQHWVLWFDAAGFWASGVAAGYLLTFVLGFGLVGLWWGMALGVTVTSALSCGMLFKVDWAGEAARANEEMLQMAEVSATARAQAADPEDHESAMLLAVEDGSDDDSQR